MKTKKRIKIVASAPAKGQDPITDWIGREFEVVRLNDDRTVDVKDEDAQTYVIQPAEYEWVRMGA